MADFADDKETIVFEPSDKDFEAALNYFMEYLGNQFTLNTSQDLVDDMMYEHIRHIKGIGEADTCVHFILRNAFWKDNALDKIGIHVVSNPEADAILNIQIPCWKGTIQRIYFHDGIFLTDGWVKDNG